MEKKKQIVLGLLAAGVISTIVVSFGFVAPNGKVHYDLTASESTTLIGNDFRKASNLKADQDIIGYNPSDANARMELHVDLTPVKNSTGAKHHVQVGGTGILHIGNASFPFKVDPDSLVYQATLSDGRNLVWGPINAMVKDKKGEEKHLAVGLVYLPETGQKKITCTVGTHEEGLAVLGFGDNFTVTDEMRDLITGSSK